MFSCYKQVPPNFPGSEGEFSGCIRWIGPICRPCQISVSARPVLATDRHVIRSLYDPIKVRMLHGNSQDRFVRVIGPIRRQRVSIDASGLVWLEIIRRRFLDSHDSSLIKALPPFIHEYPCPKFAFRSRPPSWKRKRRPEFPDIEKHKL